MKSHRTTQILSVGDKYMNGTIINIDQHDEGWLLTIQYKTVPDKKIFVYH